MKPILSFEPLSKHQLSAIRSSFSPMAATIAGLGEVDLAAGAGVLGNGTKCLWTRDGHRIEVWYKDGSFGAARSKEIDPDKPKHGSRP